RTASANFGRNTHLSARLLRPHGAVDRPGGGLSGIGDGPARLLYVGGQQSHQRNDARADYCLDHFYSDFVHRGRLWNELRSRHLAVEHARTAVEIRLPTFLGPDGANGVEHAVLFSPARLDSLPLAVSTPPAAALARL